MRRMLDAAPHRGTNVELHTEGSCSLGIAWPEEPAGASIAAERGVAVALCGRIDNLDDLAARFGLRPPRPVSPAAVVLAAFGALGDEAPNVLRGAFSGVLTDGQAIRAFRDHVGFGVLHYQRHEGVLYVATEGRQVLAGSGAPRSPDRRFLESLLYDHFEDETLCALRGVRRLPQGSILVGGPDRASWRRFWRPDRLLETSGSGRVQGEFDELMAQAVARTLTGNDIIALSGGIESTAIAAYAAPEHRRRWGRPPAALSAVFPRSPAIDERAAVETVARELGLELHVFTPEERPLDRLRERVYRWGGPAPSSFSQPRELYDAARDLGYRTILNGNYGELATDAGQPHLLAHLVRARRWRAVKALLDAQRARRVPPRSIARQLARTLVPSALGDAYDRWRRAGRLGPDWLDPRRLPRAYPRQVRARGRWRQAQLGSFYVPRLQVEADEVEQAFAGVHVRWPWADVDLWEFFLRLPAETKYPDLRPRKLFVRRLLRGRVPDAILDRPEKIVYGDAEMRWIDYGALRELFSDPPERIAGVDYDRLGTHLQSEDVPARDFRYLQNLAAIHIFLEEWTHRDAG